MATPSEITITIDGPNGHPKSRIAEAVQDALSKDGVWVFADPAHGGYFPRNFRVNELAGVVVRIVESPGVAPLASQSGVA